MFHPNSMQTNFHHTKKNSSRNFTQLLAELEHIDKFRDYLILL